MKEVVKKEIISDLGKAAVILEKKKGMDIEALRQLSNQAIEDIALHKDLDMVSVTVLFYSIYKVNDCLDDQIYNELIRGLMDAQKALQKNMFGKYNRIIKKLYKIVRGCNAKVKQHLQDVMDAARIKKGTVLLQKGLSLGQAAGLMGLSNWDLQAYASKTVLIGAHREKVQAKVRLNTAFNIFGVAK